MHRFYAPDFDPTRPEVTLSAEEASHLTRVLRLRPGDRVRLFDGRGKEWLAEVIEVGRAARVRPLAPAQPAPEPAVRLTLAQSILKSENQDALLRDAAMLGVAAIQPLWSSHTAVSRATLRSVKTLGRWRRIVVSSCKQSGRAVVPEVRSPLEFTAVLASDRSELRLLLVEPRAGIETLPASALAGRPAPDSATLMVGPEGGWSQTEITQAVKHGVQPVRLGGRTLRADAVPIVALAVLLFTWGDL